MRRVRDFTGKASLFAFAGCATVMVMLIGSDQFGLFNPVTMGFAGGALMFVSLSLHLLR